MQLWLHLKGSQTTAVLPPPALPTLTSTTTRAWGCRSFTSCTMALMPPVTCSAVCPWLLVPTQTTTICRKRGWSGGEGGRLRGLWLPTQALLTLGRMCSSSPFSRRHSTCCVLSPPMPKLSACRGEKSSRQICGQEAVWAQGHRQHGPPLSIQRLTKCHHVRALFYESSLVKSHLKQTPIWSNLTLHKPIMVSLS